MQDSKRQPRWKQVVAFVMGVVLGTCMTADAGTNITFNGSSYTVPAVADASWGNAVSNYLIAIASGALQKTGGSFTLTAETDFGSTYGLRSPYFKSKTSVISSAGVLRMGTSDAVSWRNAANSADLPLIVDSNDLLKFNGNQIYTNAATGAANGYLSSTDWATFNSKQAALTLGNIAEVTSDVLNITGGTSAVVGSGVAITVNQADETTDGYLSSTDWAAFNALTAGSVPSSRVINTTSPLSGGGALSGDLTLTITQAGSSANGYLSSTDWQSFNALSTAGGTAGRYTPGAQPGYTGGSAISTGNVGAQLTTNANGGTACSDASYTTVATKNLPAGVYLVSGACYVAVGTSVTQVNAKLLINGNNNSNYGQDFVAQILPFVNGDATTLSMGLSVANFSASHDVVMQVEPIGGTATAYCYVTGVRIN